MKEEIRPIAWLLLREGHAVPITGLAPNDLKDAAHELIVRGDEKLKHSSRLTAIVDCLGFDGDWGNYVNKHWPRVQRLIELRPRRNLFDVPANDLYFASTRRALADRLTLGIPPVPKRVFLGCDYDWSAWDRYFGEEVERGWWPEDDAFVPRELEATRRWVYRHRTMMASSAANLIGDQWLDFGTPAIDAVLTMYRPTQDEDPRAAKVVMALRWVLDRENAGWIDVVPVTDRLVLLRSRGGSYDFVFANLRETPPPAHVRNEQSSMLHAIDTPSSLHGEAHFETWNYHRLDAWEEREQHAAETRYYAAGGGAGASYPGVVAIVERYLRAEGVYGEKRPFRRTSTAPEGFQMVSLSDGRRLLVSDLITIEQMRTMMSGAGYAGRRHGDDWYPGNSDDPQQFPTAATWYDAQAYCAWMERKLGVLVRLPTVDEYREWFPTPDFDKERPRYGDHVPSGVERLEAWSGVEGQPERVRFAPDLRWITASNGIRAVHAVQVLEWTDRRFAVNPLGTFTCAPKTWGAYKNLKVVFRIVAPVEVSP